MNSTCQRPAGSDEGLKSAAAMKLGFHSRTTRSQLPLKVLEDVLITLHTEFHTNSLIAFLMTLGEIRRLSVLINDSGLAPSYSPTFAASSALYDEALPLLKRLCGSLLPEASLFRPWYHLGTELGKCSEQLITTPEIDLQHVVAAIDGLKAHGADQVRALLCLRSLSGKAAASPDILLNLVAHFPEVERLTEADSFDRFVEFALYDVERLDLRQETEVASRLSERERWMYKERMRGSSYKEISESIKGQFPDLDENRPITSLSGIKSAVGRYATKNNLPLILARRGRRKGR
jgi:hypothetical protein